MSVNIIRVENLGKKYVIQHNAKRADTFRDALMTGVRSLGNRLRRPWQQVGNGPHEEFWALKDVNFEIKRGEVVGIIGRNGAGKSTLLKILSRITEPTTGRITIDGRVASLLEIGTGFHSELSGRENIYLNGAILGMRRAEIASKFDEIVAFAEVEKFIDTAVKHYSSGMYMRLAFAVAAHLEPDILVVDEVLAVGDAYFQSKCLGKMEEVAAGQGRTVLFVSHNMTAIMALCKKVILLAEGRLEGDGFSANVIPRYYSNLPCEIENEVDLTAIMRRTKGSARFSALKLRVLKKGVAHTCLPYPGCDFSIRVTVECHSEIPESNVAIIIYDASFRRLIDVNTALKGRFVAMLPGETADVDFVLKDILLKPGDYFVSLWIGRGALGDIDAINNAARFTIVDSIEESRHVEVFPGPYQCRFDLSIDLTNKLNYCKTKGC